LLLRRTNQLLSELYMISNSEFTKQIVMLQANLGIIIMLELHLAFIWMN